MKVGAIFIKLLTIVQAKKTITYLRLTRNSKDSFLHQTLGFRSKTQSWTRAIKMLLRRNVRAYLSQTTVNIDYLYPLLFSTSNLFLKKHHGVLGFWGFEESATTTLDRRKQTILSNDSNLERDTPGQVVSEISITRRITKFQRHKNNISNMFNSYLLR